MTHSGRRLWPPHPYFGLSSTGLKPLRWTRSLPGGGYETADLYRDNWRRGRMALCCAGLIQKKADVIVHDSTVGTAAAKRATSTIPNVMALVLDPVGSGLVRSLANPGGNITGLSMMTTVDLNSKRL